MTKARRPGLRAGRRSGSPPSTTTARSGREQPYLRPGRLRARPGQGPGRRRTPSGRTSRRSRPCSRATSRRSWPARPRDRLELVARQPRRDDDRGVRPDRQRTGWRRPGIPGSSGRTPSWSISRCCELLAYLRANGFKTFIVSGGGVEFMRPWAERVYGIPPEQVVGSTIKVKYELRDGQPVLRPPRRDRLHRRRGGQARRHPAARSAAGRSPRSATPTATTRCSAGRPPAPAPGSA